MTWPSRPAARHTVSMKTRLAAAGLVRGGTRPGPPQPAAGPAESTTARVSAARSRAGERADRQRELLRPLGWAFIVIVAGASLQSSPPPGLRGTRLAVTVSLAVYAAAVATAIAGGWARRGRAAQATVIGLTGGCGVALAVLQPHGPAELAASMGVWLAAVRLPTAPAVAATTAITAALAAAIALTQHPAAQSAIAATLLCLLLAVTGQFIRRGRESQDRAEMLLAQLEDARDAEAAAAAVAERGRIAGELHDVLAHSLSGLTIQLQGARKLAAREPVSPPLRAAIERSAQLAKEGLADARQAVGALRGDRLPGLDQLGALVEDFRRDTGISAALTVEGTPRPLQPAASLALYRGAQEALTNVARYAAGAEVAVTVRHTPGSTLLAIENHDGVPASRAMENGMTDTATTYQDAANRVTTHRAATDAGTVDGRATEEGSRRPGTPPLAGVGGGYGLATMRERLQQAGGTARAGPTPGGWLVELEVPG
jgi:signal transduction histidine kinase